MTIEGEDIRASRVFSRAIHENQGAHFRCRRNARGYRGSAPPGVQRSAFERHRPRVALEPRQYARLLATAGGKERLAAFIDSLPVWRRGAARSWRPGSPPSTRPRPTIYARLIAEGAVPLREGVQRLFEAAERAGVKLAIASTTTLANIEALLGAHLGARRDSALRRHRRRRRGAAQEAGPGHLPFRAARVAACRPPIAWPRRFRRRALTAAKAAGLFTRGDPEPMDGERGFRGGRLGPALARDPANARSRRSRGDSPPSKNAHRGPVEERRRTRLSRGEP